jgi:hypothetical protein
VKDLPERLCVALKSSQICVRRHLMLIHTVNPQVLAVPESMKLQLDWSDLILSHAWIDNQKTGSSDGLSFTVEDPTNGTMPDCGEAEAEAAVDAAYRAFSCWRGVLAKERAQYLQSWLPAIRKHAEDFTRLISLEQGNRWARAGVKSITARPTSSGLPRGRSGFTEM